MTKIFLGTVTDVRSAPAKKEQPENGRLLLGEDPYYSDVTLTLSVDADNELTVSDRYQLRAGKTMYLRLPRYCGVGTCLSLLKGDNA